jgi:hypothetical protein
MTRTSKPILLVTLLAVVAAPRASAQDRADALAQQFFAHLRANAPIAGEFQIRGVIDPEFYEEHRKEAERMSGNSNIRITPEPAEQLLNCRWAWDRDREMAETLPGGRNVFATFYSNREALLLGSDPGVFNLHKPRHNPKYRPANFYFLGGASGWPELLGSCQFTTQPATAGSPEGTVQLIAHDSRTKAVTRLLVEESSGVMHMAEIEVNSKLYFRLVIDSFVKATDHRIFPAKARLMIYVDAHSDRPYRVEELLAKAVRFPTLPGDVDHAFELTLPKGTKIADRLLNRTVDIRQPTSAQDILAGKVPSKPIETAKPAVAQERLTVPAKSNLPWVLLWASLGIVLILGGIWLLRRVMSTKAAT